MRGNYIVHQANNIYDDLINYYNYYKYNIAYKTCILLRILPIAIV